jgi:hypothetical protein
MKIGIIGSRRRNTATDFYAVECAFKQLYKEGFSIVSGGCPQGGDAFAEKIAKDNGIPILIFYPNWRRYGKAAGFVRNAFIAKEADILIACVASDRKGGTENTIKHYQRMGKTQLILV